MYFYHNPLSLSYKNIPMATTKSITAHVVLFCVVFSFLLALHEYRTSGSRENEQEIGIPELKAGKLPPNACHCERLPGGIAPTELFQCWVGNRIKRDFYKTIEECQKNCDSKHCTI